MATRSKKKTKKKAPPRKQQHKPAAGPQKEISKVDPPPPPGDTGTGSAAGDLIAGAMKKITAQWDSDSHLTRTDVAEVRLLLGIMRDRALLLAHSSDETFKKLCDGFSQRTIAIYDRILLLLDPQFRRLEFRTEIRFASEADAKAAAAELEGKPDA